MDPCMIAAEILGSCVSAAPAGVKAKPESPGMAQTIAKEFKVTPSATTIPPETVDPLERGALRGCSGAAGALMSGTNCAGTTAQNAMAISARQGIPATINRLSQPSELPRSVSRSGGYPGNGDQLFAFRRAALQSGAMYTRIAPERYRRYWQRPAARASYQDWKGLLSREAAVMAHSQGNNRLTILVGDSLSLWIPIDQLPRSRFWLNQSISGETTEQILNRLAYFQATQPDQIHIMAGINDLKNGASDAEIIHNLHQMLVRLGQQHPGAQLVMYSILPTRLASLPSDRIRTLNQHIAYIARQQGAEFSDLQTSFADSQGLLRRDLTTDGLHLSPQGYGVWQSALVDI